MIADYPVVMVMREKEVITFVSLQNITDSDIKLRLPLNDHDDTSMMQSERSLWSSTQYLSTVNAKSFMLSFEFCYTNDGTTRVDNTNPLIDSRLSLGISSCRWYRWKFTSNGFR